MNKKEKFDILVAFIKDRYGKQETFLHYNKDYELLIAIILSAQAKDDVVNKVTKTLFEKYNSLEELKNASYDDVFEIIKYVGLGKNKTNFVIKTAQILVDKYHGVIPLDRKELMTLPGVGSKVAGVFLGEIYNYPYLPVDTHIQRIAKRLEFVKKDDTPDEIEKKLLKLLDKNENSMDIHRNLISFGREICLSGRSRNCYMCPLEKICKNKQLSTSKKSNVKSWINCREKIYSWVDFLFDFNCVSIQEFNGESCSFFLNSNL